MDDCAHQLLTVATLDIYTTVSPALLTISSLSCSVQRHTESSPRIAEPHSFRDSLSLHVQRSAAHL